MFAYDPVLDWSVELVRIMDSREFNAFIREREFQWTDAGW